MKKTICLLMIALLLLVGCSKNNSATNNNNNIIISSTNDNNKNNSSNNNSKNDTDDTDNTDNTDKTNNTDDNSQNNSSNNKDTAANVDTDNSKIEDAELKKLQTKLDDMFTIESGAKKFNGMVLIAKQGEIILNKGYGLADVENKIEFTDKTKFDVASLTKQFTAVSILQLEEKGLLTTNDTIDKFFPDFPRGNEITIHQLLTHTSGLGDPGEFDITCYKPSNSSTDRIIDTTKLEFAYEPNKYFNYSSVGYILLGYIIESITKTELDVYFKENIFDVADMNNSGFKDKDFHIDNLAVGYSNFDYEKAPVSSYDESISTVRGSAALCTTVEDLYAWNKALFSGKIINKESLEKAHTPYRNSYGYGWLIYQGYNKKYVFHYGTTSGYESYMAINPKEDTFAVFISNVNDSNRELIKIYIKSLLF